ncbi:hypothetical protein FGO68_gene16042 [Halteria grandinella]|uniref:Uncharacterized protein n=1 Tax=Halteria grandinella TaxID=5974 RepID=A0A8J8SUB9_HALGN|nr:hypothetical protein FGO68_gene16042 [Halteria grandinella]
MINSRCNHPNFWKLMKNFLESLFTRNNIAGCDIFFFDSIMLQSLYCTRYPSSCCNHCICENNLGQKYCTYFSQTSSGNLQYTSQGSFVCSFSYTKINPIDVPGSTFKASVKNAFPDLTMTTTQKFLCSNANSTAESDSQTPSGGSIFLLCSDTAFSKSRRINLSEQ